MNRKFRRIFFAFVSALFVTVSVSSATLEVSTIKQQNGQEVVLVKPAEQSGTDGPQAVTLIKRYSPSFWSYYDLNEPVDGVYDMFACGENQTNGQITCRGVDTMTGTSLSSVNFLDPSFNLPPYYVSIMDFNNDGSYDAMACGLKLTDNSVVCQIRNLKTGTNVGVGQFTAIPASEGLSYSEGFSRYGYVNTDGDSNTLEYAFCYKKSATEQIACRVLNPLTGALISTIPILNKNFDAGIWTAYFMDMNGDGKQDVVNCGRNRTTGQSTCQIMNGTTGGLIRSVQLMTPTDNVTSWTHYYDYYKASTLPEFQSCGWNLVTKQPKCEIRRQNSTIFKGMNILNPNFIP